MVGQVGIGVLLIDEDDLAAGRVAFYLWGIARYRDAFGDQQVTDFRLMYSPRNDPEGKGLMSFCEEGNQAS
jgi:hypothetical protein